jgi:hypothetical protein
LILAGCPSTRYLSTERSGFVGSGLLSATGRARASVSIRTVFSSRVVLGGVSRNRVPVLSMNTSTDPAGRGGGSIR